MGLALASRTIRQRSDAMAARKTPTGKKPARATAATAKEPTVSTEPVLMLEATPAAQEEALPEPVELPKPEPKLRLAKSASPAASSRASSRPPVGYPDLAALGRENLAAVARANAVLVKGFEELGQEVAGYAQHNLVSAVDTARALVGVRTIADLVALNRKVAQATLEGALANSARLSEIGIRVATEALGPLKDRVAETFGRLARPAG
jgi:phasin family protein